MAIVVTPDHDGTQDTASSEGGVYSDTRSFLLTGLRAAHPDTGKRRIKALFHPDIPRDGEAHPLGLGLTVLRRTAKMVDQDTAVVVVQYGRPDVAQFDPQQNGMDVRIGTTSNSVESNIDGAGETIITSHDGTSENIQTISSMESMSTLEITRLQQDSPGLVAVDFVRHVNSEANLFGATEQKGCWYCQSINGSWVSEVNQWLASYVFVYRLPYMAHITATGDKVNFEGWQVRVIEHNDNGVPYPRNEWEDGTVKIVSPFPYRTFGLLNLAYP